MARFTIEQLQSKGYNLKGDKAEKKLKELDAESASTEKDKLEAERKKAIIAAAIARAKEKLNQP